MNPTIENKNLVPQYQYRFIEKQSSIQQVHEIVNQIDGDLDEHKFYSEMFISQTFDRFS